MWRPRDDGVAAAALQEDDDGGLFDTAAGSEAMGECDAP